MEKEFKSLSEKVKQIGYDKIDLHTKVYPEKHVKEFIKILIEADQKQFVDEESRIYFIKQHAGDKLI